MRLDNERNSRSLHQAKSTDRNALSGLSKRQHLAKGIMSYGATVRDPNGEVLVVDGDENNGVKLADLLEVEADLLADFLDYFLTAPDSCTCKRPHSS